MLDKSRKTIASLSATVAVTLLALVSMGLVVSHEAQAAPVDPAQCDDTTAAIRNTESNIMASELVYGGCPSNNSG